MGARHHRGQASMWAKPPWGQIPHVDEAPIRVLPALEQSDGGEAPMGAKTSWKAKAPGGGDASMGAEPHGSKAPMGRNPPTPPPKNKKSCFFAKGHRAVMHRCCPIHGVTRIRGAPENVKDKLQQISNMSDCEELFNILDYDSGGSPDRELG